MSNQVTTETKKVSTVLEKSTRALAASQAELNALAKAAPKAAGVVVNAGK